MGDHQNKNRRFIIILFVAVIVVSVTAWSEGSDTAGLLGAKDVLSVLNMDVADMPGYHKGKVQLQMPISKNILLGKLDPRQDGDFEPVDASYANRGGMYMQREAYVAFREMHAAARAEGITLTIMSAMRTFEHQKRIWEEKWNGRRGLHGHTRATSIEDPVERAREILRYSAMPGTSRHHWGTDIDLNCLHNNYFEHGEGKRVYEWLMLNAATFGFCQPYTAHGEKRSRGYEEEKWHWSYLPVASAYLQAYKETISYSDIRGFDGCETAREIGVIKNFVLDVNTDCQ